MVRRVSYQVYNRLVFQITKVPAAKLVWCHQLSVLLFAIIRKQKYK
jgi:hypothetical protein